MLGGEGRGGGKGGGILSVTFKKKKNPKHQNDFVFVALSSMLFLAACGLVDAELTKSQLTKQDLV